MAVDYLSVTGTNAQKSYTQPLPLEQIGANSGQAFGMSVPALPVAIKY